jgi:hypothetical protein
MFYFVFDNKWAFNALGFGRTAVLFLFESFYVNGRGLLAVDETGEMGNGRRMDWVMMMLSLELGHSYIW